MWCRRGIEDILPGAPWRLYWRRSGNPRIWHRLLRKISADPEPGTSHGSRDCRVVDIVLQDDTMEGRLGPESHSGSPMSLRYFVGIRGMHPWRESGVDAALWGCAIRVSWTEPRWYDGDEACHRACVLSLAKRYLAPLEVTTHATLRPTVPLRIYYDLSRGIPAVSPGLSCYDEDREADKTWTDATALGCRLWGLSGITSRLITEPGHDTERMPTLRHRRSPKGRIFTSLRREMKSAGEAPRRRAIYHIARAVAMAGRLGCKEAGMAGFF